MDTSDIIFSPGPGARSKYPNAIPTRRPVRKMSRHVPCESPGATRGEGRRPAAAAGLDDDASAVHGRRARMRSSILGMVDQASTPSIPAGAGRAVIFFFGGAYRKPSH